MLSEATPAATASTAARALAAAREGTLALVADLEDAQVERPLHPLMSPLVWDLAHIAAYEDLWAVNRLAGHPLLRPDLAGLYDAFETPRPGRAAAPLLGREAALDYMNEVRARTLWALADAGPSELHELVLRHELQHTETMRQALFLGGLPGGSAAAQASFPAEPEWVAFDRRLVEVGAASGGFAYDNERPRHRVECGPYAIAGTPVTNAAFARFVDDGGYDERAWWSPAGWEWRLASGSSRPLGWGAIPPAPGAPVEHVSWFEADAYARSRGARLPTESEWERAAAGGALAGIGAVWEWTADEFRGYPGFRAHPYREYSEVFFDKGYRVLRGCSWATSRRVASTTFRNWDLPERRQIFAGIRLARDCD